MGTVVRIASAQTAAIMFSDAHSNARTVAGRTARWAKLLKSADWYDFSL